MLVNKTTDFDLALLLKWILSRSHLSPETADFFKYVSQSGYHTHGSSLKFMWSLENRADIYP
jgi:3'-phosphoadenosine 5'-phosphosulfate (PAPS) 3'-phosphatase